MSGKQTNQPSYAGIVVTGETRDLAVQAYANVAQGQDLQILASADNGFMLATTAGATTFYNPQTEDKEEMVALEQDLEVTSSANDNDGLVSVAYTVCTDCDTHIIADSAEEVHHCPACHASVDFSMEFEDEDLESDSASEELTGDQGFVIAASSAEEVATQLQNLLQDPSNARVFESESGVSFVSHKDSCIKHDPFNSGKVEGTELSAEAASSLEANASSMDPVANYFQCIDDECGSHIISQSSDTIFCPRCESAVVDPEDVNEMEQHMQALESDSMDDMDYEDDDLMDDETDELDDLEDDFDEDEEDDLESDSASGFDDLDDEFEVLATSDDDLESDSMDDFEDIEDDLESDSSDDDEDEIEGLEDEEDDDDDDGDEDEDDLESDSTTASVSEIDALALVANSTEGGLQPEGVSLVNCSSVAGENRWMAFYNEHPVAIASESSVDGAAKQIFDTPSYRTAVLQAVANDGVQKGLEQFGFKSLSFDTDTIQVAVSNQIIAEANSKIETFEKAQQERDAVLMDRVGQALATSMMGIDRGVFTGKSNPMISALASKLTSAGIADARSLVESVFAATADSYNKTVLDQTLELVAKAPETQEEIAKMVAASSHVRSPEGIHAKSAIEDRLTPRTVDKPIESKSSAGDLHSRMAALSQHIFK